MKNFPIPYRDFFLGEFIIIKYFGIPCDHFSTFSDGPKEAPQHIRSSLSCDSSNYFSETGVDLSKYPDLIADFGDLDVKIAHLDFKDQIQGKIDSKDRPIFFGGDHSITYPILQHLKKLHQKIDVIHIDAHPDLYHKYRGNLYTNASPFARIMEEKLVENLYQIGIRTLTAHQKEQAEKFSVKILEMRNLKSNWQKDIQPKNPIYLSIDLDGFDPAYAPGVSYPVPGGLSSREVLSMIHGLTMPIIGADIVEYNPKKDLNGLTGYLCAKLVKEIVGMMVLDIEKLS